MCQCGAGVIGDRREAQDLCSDGTCWVGRTPPSDPDRSFVVCPWCSYPLGSSRSCPRCQVEHDRARAADGARLARRRWWRDLAEDALPQLAGCALAFLFVVGVGAGLALGAELAGWLPAVLR